jgi:hypothetical protein
VPQGIEQQGIEPQGSGSRAMNHRALSFRALPPMETRYTELMIMHRLLS